MRSLARATFIVFVTGCAPAVAHLGGNTYRLSCEEGMGVCRQNANRVCQLGYDIVETSTASSGAGTMIVRCAEPKLKAKSASPVAEKIVLDESVPCPELPEGVECLRNFQCSGEGARCIDGKCVAAATWFDTPAATDAGAPPSGVAERDAGAAP
jgi:hypothetical protein